MKLFKGPQSLITLFVIILLTMALMTGMNMAKLFNASLIKFAMNGVLVLSLIPMLNVGAGMNFSLPVGVCGGLVGLCVAVNFKLKGLIGWSVAILVTILICTLFGIVLSFIFNRVKGKEEIAGTFIGFSFIPLMNYFWTLVPFTNRQMLYPIGGRGTRPKIGLGPYFAKYLDKLWNLKIGELEIPLGLLCFYGFIALGIYLFFKSQAGQKMIAVGHNEDFAYFSGIEVNKTRRNAVILSTIIAGIGICVYSQSYEFIELYDSPLMMAFPAISAILIGGSSGKKTNIKMAILGTYLFQSIYLLSVPLANQLLLPEISEILRMLITNAIILYALLQNKKGGVKKCN